jgi:hypothetical protein
VDNAVCPDRVSIGPYATVGVPFDWYIERATRHRHSAEPVEE